MSLHTLAFALVDVFAGEPLAGNGLAVFLLDEDLSTSAMQRITREMRQFETIFLRREAGATVFRTRIFTMEEELPFAGHPIIGAAAFLHAELFATQALARIEFLIAGRSIAATSRRDDDTYHAEMEQGIASIQAALSDEQSLPFLQALNLSALDQAAGLPLQVVSTGLPYLLVPIRSNLAAVRIVNSDFEALLATVGARFAYVLDVDGREGRTWDNGGRIEDIATGSAAGPVAAYLVTHKLAAPGATIVLRQGRFLDRPSELHAVARGSSALSVTVKGQVYFVGRGVLTLPGTSL